jgi:hypothetical protein
MSTLTKRISLLVISLMVVNLTLVLGGYAHAVTTPTPTPAPTPTEASSPEKSFTLIPVVESSHPYPNSYDESWLISNLDARPRPRACTSPAWSWKKGVDWLIVMDARMWRSSA